MLTMIALPSGQAGVAEAWGIDPTSTVRDLRGSVLSPAVYLPSVPMTPAGPHVYPSCRFGVTVGGSVSSYDVAGLNVGWYLDWGAKKFPQQPGGAEYYQMIRLSQLGGGFTYRPNGGELNAIIDANPGAVWLIGNEQDRRVYQDDLAAEVYALAYRHLHDLIKDRDPSAKIAIGGVVQLTPLRLQYLDAVWNAYLAQYGSPPPVDVWNVHSFILREISPDHPQAQQPGYEVWGAGIPRGTQFDSVMEGTLYQISEQDDLPIFRERIIQFRQWMADKGQRDKPLIVSEYGILFPEDYYDEHGQQLSAERVGAFMRGTFNFFRNQTDADIGYPADGNRLVQQWAWFSANANPWYWGGTLFDTNNPGTLRPLGEDFRSYVSEVAPAVDLSTVRAVADPDDIPYQGVPVTATLKAVVSNAGNVTASSPFTVTFYDGPLGQGNAGIIGEPRVVSQGLRGCGNYTVISESWGGLGAGSHPFSVRVEIGEGDINLTNNSVDGTLFIADHRAFLPMELVE